MSYWDDAGPAMLTQIKTHTDWAEKCLQDESANRQRILEYLISRLRILTWENK